MTTALQLRRGTTTQHGTFTGALGEVTVDTTKKTAVVHDGSTAGGNPLATEALTTAKTSGTGASVLPVGTTAQRDASPQAGYIRFNSTTGGFEGYNGTTWAPVGGGNTTSNGMWEHANTISSNYSITSGNNAVAAGAISIASGVTVTVPSGSTWTVV